MIQFPTEAEPVVVVRADAVEFLRSLPDDSIDLLFTSPPYELARTYGIGEKMVGGQAWVDWMVEVVTAAAPKVKGLIAVNCEGQTKDYRYSCVPFLLVADLHRAGFNLRKPCVYERDGIPGSGGPDWLKNRWEPIICVTRPGKLPWSDNTACGHTPKYDAGGDPSHRKADGERVNKFGSMSSRGQDGRRKMAGGRAPKVAAAMKAGLPPGAKYHTKNNGSEMRVQVYVPPERANPGNVLKYDVGGGLMGHALAHENEAPFPLKLAEFFVESFCPPGGVCCDPFAGSGTTAHAAFAHGRRFAGADIRQSQVDLTRRRIRTVTPSMFAGTEDRP